jgi:heptosyltransferase-3
MSNLAAVFQIGSLGDAIVSIPSLLSLKEYLPACSEYLLVSGLYSKRKVSPGDIFEMAWKPKAQLQYAGPERRLQQLFSVPAVLAKLRYYNPSHCVSLMPADREPERVERDKKFFKAAGIKNLVGFEPLPRSYFEPSSSTQVDGTEAFFRFQRIWGEAASEKFGQYSRVPLMSPSVEAVKKIRQWLRLKRSDSTKPLIAISPYSNFSSRDVPDQTLANLIPELARQACADIVIIGGAKDTERAAKLIGRDPCALNACGAFSVQESAALLKECKLAICADSGPMHLAAAVGVPLLVTNSRINSKLGRWLPFGQRSTILYRDVPCAGCFKVECPVPGHPCMQDISADQILACALNLLKGLPVLESRLNGTKVVTRHEL